MNKLIVAPCKDCELRKPGCHPRCPAYKEYERKISEYKKVRNITNALADNRRGFWEDVKKHGLGVRKGK